MPKVNKKLSLFFRDFKRMKLGTFAAAGTFYLFLSLPSIILIVVSVLPYTNIEAAMLERLLQRLFPTYLYDLIESLVNNIYVASGARLSVSIVATVWTASLCMAALMRGLRASYDVDKRENYLVLRIKALFYMVLLLATGFITLGVIVFGRQLFYLALDHLGLNEGFRAFAGLLRIGRYVFVFILMNVTFVLLYRFASGTKMTLRHHFIGAVFTTLCWLGFSSLFSWYVSRSAVYSVYGVLGTVFIAMLWVYYSLFLMLIGGYLNRFLYKIKAEG